MLFYYINDWRCFTCTQLINIYRQSWNKLEIKKLVSFKVHSKFIYERRVGKVFGMHTFGKTNFNIIKISSKKLLLVF